MKRILKLIKCFIHGRCPECNSDAPKIDTCWVCKSYRTGFNGMPDDKVRGQWWIRYIEHKRIVQYKKSISK